MILFTVLAHGPREAEKLSVSFDPRAGRISPRQGDNVMISHYIIPLNDLSDSINCACLACITLWLALRAPWRDATCASKRAARRAILV